MKIIDLSYELNNQIKEYPGDLPFKLEKGSNESDSSTLFNLSTGLHNGTHMDSPFHYIDSGKRIKDFNLEDFIGIAEVIKTSDIEISTKKNSFQDIVIINTNWGINWGKDEYYINYPYLSMEFAEKLVENNVKGIAIDTCSVDKHGNDEIHKLLLKNNIWIVENIANCDKLVKNTYESYFIPLKIDAEASPVRAFVID